MSKVNELKAEHLSRLFKFLLDIELQNDVCIFTSLSGHVDWFEISIRESKENFDVILQDWTINYFKYYDGKSIPALKIKSTVDKIISEVNELLDNLQESKRVALNKRDEKELKELARLKEKFEGAK